MSASQKKPKVFISYSWSGAEHEQFVEDLVAALRNYGIDAILDKWRLKPGQDKYVFMESMVTDPEMAKVLVLCDHKYQEKADRRAGGVGTESQIISQDVYNKVDQTKFIPVVCERGPDGEPYVPVFLKGRIYVDMSSDEAYGAGLDELLRQIYDKPLSPEPLLGEAPAFLKADGGGALPMARELPGAVRAIKDGKQSREGLAMLFVRSVVKEVERQYVQPENSSGYDEEIYQAILRTKQLRDQVSEYADSLAAFSGDDPKALKACFYLLEQLGQRFGPPVVNGPYLEAWADLYKFFALESTLVITAALIRNERWLCLRALFKYPYLVRTDHNEPTVSSVDAFDAYIASIDEHRNNRLKANRACLTADLLKERCSTEHTPFSELVQADLFLALACALRVKELKGGGWNRRYWKPRTSIYTSDTRGLPIFLKAVDQDIKRGIYQALGVADATEMASKVLDASSELDEFKMLASNRSWGYNFVAATNLQTLIKP